jgi:hypothetical protein
VVIWKISLKIRRSERNESRRDYRRPVLTNSLSHAKIRRGIGASDAADRRDFDTQRGILRRTGLRRGIAAGWSEWLSLTFLNDAAR